VTALVGGVGGRQFYGLHSGRRPGIFQDGIRRVGKIRQFREAGDLGLGVSSGRRMETDRTNLVYAAGSPSSPAAFPAALERKPLRNLPRQEYIPAGMESQLQRSSRNVASRYRSGVCGHGAAPEMDHRSCRPAFRGQNTSTCGTFWVDHNPFLFADRPEVGRFGQRRSGFSHPLTVDGRVSTILSSRQSNVFHD